MGGKMPSGFTIVETLIFLAVSGLLLASAINFISGKTDNTEFNQGVNQLVSNLRLQISQVEVGSFDSTANFTCGQTGPGVNISITPVTPGSNGEGTNLGCQYIGEAIQFAPGGNANQYVIYPVAGNEYSDGVLDTPVTSINQLLPCAIAANSQGLIGHNCTSTVNATNSDAQTTYTLPYGLTIKSVEMSGPVNIGMVAYYTPPTDTNISGCSPIAIGNQNDNGGLNVDLIPFVDNSSGNPLNKIDQSMCNGASLSSYAQQSQYNLPVTVCLISGSTNQFAAITLGSQNNPASVDLKVQNSSC